MKDDFVMKPESFAKKLIEILKSKFSRKLEFDYQCVLKTNDCIKPAILVREPEGYVAKTIYIDGLYKKHTEVGANLEEIAEGIKNICEESSDFEKIITAELFAKMENLDFLLGGNVMLKLVNKEKSETFLKGKTYIPFLDLAIVFYMTLTDGVDNSLGTVAIPEICSKEWGISLEDAYNKVLESTEKNYPIHRVTMKEFLIELLNDAFGDIEEIDKLDLAEDMYIQTNTQKINGSATLLYKNNLKRFCEEKGISYLYIIPSSQHEVILVPCKQQGDEQQLQQMIRDVNASQVQEHEVLSDSLYIYNYDTDMITIWNE